MNELTVSENRDMVLLDESQMKQCLELAEIMAQSSLLPEHLTKSGSSKASPEQIKANCFRIINQALRWEVDPFALLDETYVVHGRLAYQGKLVMAIVNTRAGLNGGLRFEFNDKTGDDLAVTVTGTFRDGRTESITCSVGDKKTDNGIWKKNPRQKLCYTGSVEWARRHCPQVILGILTTEDAEVIEGSVVEPKTRVFIGQDSDPEKQTEPEPKSKDKAKLDMDSFVEYLGNCKTLAAVNKAAAMVKDKELTDEQDVLVAEYLTLARERVQAKA